MNIRRVCSLVGAVGLLSLDASLGGVLAVCTTQVPGTVIPTHQATRVKDLSGAGIEFSFTSDAWAPIVVDVLKDGRPVSLNGTSLNIPGHGHDYSGRILEGPGR